MSEPDPMRISVDLLLEGVARTLLEQVLPQLASRPARGQLFAAIDVLRNLARRVEPAQAPLAEEARSAEGALRGAADALRTNSAAALAARIEERIAAWPASVPARVVAARETLSQAFEWLDEAPAAAAAVAAPLLGGHLAAQALRALALLQPSMLEEISRG
jgi:hypothetical protein